MREFEGRNQARQGTDNLDAGLNSLQSTMRDLGGAAVVATYLKV